MKSFVLKALLVIFAMLGVSAGGIAWYAHRPLAIGAPELDFTVARGATMRQAAAAIAAAGVPVEPRLLYWIARIGGRADRIVAGSYVAAEGITPWLLILKIANGEVTRSDILLVEGWNFRQVRAAVEAHPYLLKDTEGMGDTELLAAIGATESHPEGLFFPDTYVFDRHSSALAVFREAYRAMQRKLEEAWNMRDPATPLKTPYEALILASIIEKETGQAQERGLVASVFSNRLRIGMRLQTDPTVIYGFGEGFEGRLRRRHLDTDHDYNTYMRGGLPPTPIAMPGWHSLEAAVKPVQSEYLYFVARGDGTSVFSRNLTDHNRAVNQYQRGGQM